MEPQSLADTPPEQARQPDSRLSRPESVAEAADRLRAQARIVWVRGAAQLPEADPLIAGPIREVGRSAARVAFSTRPALGQPAVSPAQVKHSPRKDGEILSAISDGMAALLKAFYGRGPTRAKTYYEDDLVVCLLRGGFSRVEQTLLDGGRGSSVIQQRMDFQDLMRKRFEAIIEDATGRRVIGFMSGNQQNPDIMCEVFILDPTDLVDEPEITDSP